MDNKELLNILENAHMIVCGYAFTKSEEGNIRVLNIRPPHHALVMSQEGDIYETSMDDIEIDIVLGYWEKNKKNTIPTLTKNKKSAHFPLPFQNKFVNLPRNKFCITIKR